MSALVPSESKLSSLATQRPLPTPQTQESKPPKGSPLSLYQLAKEYSQQFPLQVEILQGFYGQNANLELCTGDAYNVHFSKETQVFSIQDDNNDIYYVPLNSAFRFGLLHRHNDTVQGQVYAKVADILSSKLLPKAIAATKAFTGPIEKSSVRENEILVVLGVYKTKGPHSKKGLKVVSLATKAEKILWSDCSAHFSTDPALICMDLTDIAQYMSDALPLEARMYPREENAAGYQLPSNFLSSTVTITGRKTVTSLMISSVAGDEEEWSFMDVPVDSNLLDVEVSIIDSESVGNIQELRYQTKKILTTFSPDQAKLLLDIPQKRVYRAQSLLYATYQAGCAKLGIEIHSCIGADLSLPSPGEHGDDNMYESLTHYESIPYLNTEGENDRHANVRNQASAHLPKKPPAIRRRATTTASVNRTSDPYSYPQLIDPASFLETQSRKFETEERQKSMPRQRSKSELPESRKHQKGATTSIHDAEEYMTPVSSRASPQLDLSSDIPPRLKTVEDKMNSIEAQCIEHRLLNEELTKKMDEIVDKLTGIEATVAGIQQKKLCSNTSGVEEENIRHLRSLDVRQVQQLLEAMNLQQYKEAFRAECIDGEILHDLDEQVLKVDLGVTSKLHVLRLMKIISGAHSVEDFMNN